MSDIFAIGMVGFFFVLGFCLAAAYVANNIPGDDWAEKGSISPLVTPTVISVMCGVICALSWVITKFI